MRQRCGKTGGSRWLAAALLTALALSTGMAGAQQQRAGADYPVEIVPGIGHSDGVFSVAFSPDGRRIVSGSGDGTIKLWDVASGRELRTLRGEDGVGAVAFSPDGRNIVSGDDTGLLKFWDAAGGRTLRTLKAHTGGRHTTVVGVAFSIDGRRIVSGSQDGDLKLFDAENGRELRTFTTGHQSWLTTVAFSPDGRRLVSGSLDQTLEVWDAVSGRRLRTFTGHEEEVTSVAFSPDGRTVASGSASGMLKLWDAASGRELLTLEGHSDTVRGVAFSPDGRSVVSGSDDYTLKLWDAASGRELRSFEGHNHGVLALAFSPDGRSIVSAGSDIKLWDATSGRELRTFKRIGAAVHSTAFSPDGRTIASGNDDSTLTFWDAASGRKLHTLRGHRGTVFSISYSPDGRSIVSGSSDETLKIWDAGNWRELRTLKGHAGDVNSASFSPDGRSIVSGGSDQTVKLWDAASGRELRTLKGHSDTVWEVAFSPDGRSIVSGGSDIKLWDATSGRELRTLAGHLGDVNSVAFSPDGRSIVSVFASGSIGWPLRLWDTASGRGLRILKAHRYYVQTAAFSPDGRMIVSGSSDNTLKLWDAASGRELRTLTAHGGSVNSVAFSPDGRSFVSGSGDTTVRRWSLAGELLATTISGRDDDWVTITPEGFFDASDNGAQILNVVRGLEVYSIDQFYQALYRPDLVREKLAGDPRGLVREAAAKLDLTKVMASGAAPQVLIVSPASGSASPADDVAVEAEVTDLGGGIGRIEWRVNGVTLGVEERGLGRAEAPASPAREPVRLKRTLALEPGENRIELVAYNARNLIASEPARVTVKWNGERGPERPKLHVLAVGVNDYWDSRLRLNYAVPDVRALADAMRKAGGELYQSVEVTTVLDAEVTIDNLDKAFSALAKTVHPRDVFVFFLAGHGKTVDGKYYFLPRDFRYEDEESIVKKGVDQDRFQAWFARISARKSVLLYDTCESGSLAGERVQQRGIERVAALEKMTRAMGRTVLSASTDDAPALEGYRGHGVFTYALLEGLGAADANNNGVIEVTELASYIDQKVPDLSYAAFKYRQVPQMKIVGSNFPLSSKSIVLSAAAAPAIAAKPTHVVIAPAQVRQAAEAGAATVVRLSPGTQVTLVETKDGWAVVARDGRRLGYVETNALAALQ